MRSEYFFVIPESKLNSCKYCVTSEVVENLDHNMMEYGRTKTNRLSEGTDFFYIKFHFF